MMDELDLLKKDWKKNDNHFPKISEKDIYVMLHKKSSSIVKWLFIINVIEILFWVVIGFFHNDDNYEKSLVSYHLTTLTKFFTYTNYIICFIFIILFYKNFKKISTTDTVKQLMESILNTRKTVQYYVWYNLGLLVIMFFTMFIAAYMYDEKLNDIFSKIGSGKHPYLIWLTLSIITILVLAVVVVAYWLFYKLVYGFLLRKLNKNYTELQKIDL
ncbi:hypothetical protein [Flavobacterium sp. '19STA2R22 D10 B1']|uniref:hypothetical protein n=1 Tax=Flavobacterium aerium TaxID=3037261 RepID=UPI00278C1560|nr:hypothetical protein [Flavobacterium sp. '19STA2R22 D10 B1']